MELSFEELLAQMLQAGSEAFGEGWSDVKDYAPAEFKKISAQIIEIGENVAQYQLDNSLGYSPETGRILMQMQRTATEGVLVAISTLTMIAVQKAITAIFDVLKNVFQGVVLSIL